MRNGFPWRRLLFTFVFSFSVGIGLSYVKNSKALKKKVKCYLGYKISKEFRCEKVLSSKVANSFSYTTTEIPLKGSFFRSAGLISINTDLELNQFQVFAQDGKIARSKSHRGAALNLEVKGEDYLKSVFAFNGILYGLQVVSSADCNQAFLLNLSSGKSVYTAPCLPSGEPVDWNGIGGGSVPYGNGFLMALGAPETSSPRIRNLAQDTTSPYGKILFFQPSGIDRFEVDIFSSGHRNPQGMVAIEDKVFAVEHGPRGGDEINQIVKGGNYGWPLVSFGVNYSGPRNGVANPAEMRLPLYSFVPSIGISDITKCPQDLVAYYKPYGCLVLSSLREMSLFVVLTTSDYQSIMSIEKLPIGARVREFLQSMSGLKNFDQDSLYFTIDGGKLIKLRLHDFRH